MTARGKYSWGLIRRVFSFQRPTGRPRRMRRAPRGMVEPLEPRTLLSGFVGPPGPWSGWEVNSATVVAGSVESADVTTFFAESDAYVKSSSPTRNYGSDDIVRLRQSSEVYHGYLKFAVSGISGDVERAVVRMYVTDPSNAGGAIYPVSNDYRDTTTPWIESGLTWNNAPPISGDPLSTLGPVLVSTWVEFDVTAAVPGDGTYSFALASPSSNSVFYSSSEGLHAPELIVEATASEVPRITSFAPSSGKAGDEVIVYGRNFNEVEQVLFHATPATFEVDSDGLIRATVPAGAGSGPISVVSSKGTGTSAADFLVIAAPRIDGFAPASGRAGTEVILSGSGFTGTTQVQFHGTAAAAFTVISDTELRATVAAAATSGPIRVVNPAGEHASTAAFTVMPTPTVTSFPVEADAYVRSSSPTRNYGTASIVRLRQSSDIYHGYLQFAVSGIDGDVERAVVRMYVSGASNFGGSIHRVTNSYRDTSTPWTETGLTWNNAPPISSDPLSTLGPVQTGTWVEFDVTSAIQGDGTYSFALASSSSDTVDYRSSESTMPPELIVEAAASEAPRVTSFAPSSGKAGDEVIVYGRNFNEVEQVLFHGTAATFNVDSDGLIRATVPAGAGSGPISVVSSKGTGTSTADFLVIAAPRIDGFAPASGRAGTEVILSGSGFTGTTQVQFHGIDAAAFTVISDTELRATVPAAATSGLIRVANPGGEHLSTVPFTVLPTPTVTSFPAEADAYVRSSSPTRNYGTASIVRLRQSSDIYHGYLQFAVSGIDGDVERAVVRMYVSGASNSGGSIHRVTNSYRDTSTPWTESGLTWNNAPPISGNPLSTLGPVQTGTWVEFDVTSAIQGDGTYSFALASSSSDTVDYRSSESTMPPELIIETLPAHPLQIDAFAPLHGPMGTEVTLTGTGFLRVTSVSFHGVPAADFAVDSDTQLRATVPWGAASGPIRLERAGETATSADNFTVDNLPPVVDAGEDRVAAAGWPVPLHGDVSDDGLPQPASWTSEWTVVAWPDGGTVEFGDIHQINTTAVFSSPGTYALRLTVSDGDKAAFDEVTITVALVAPPQVDAGEDQTVTFAGDPSVIDIPAAGAPNDPFHVSPTLLTDPVASGSADDPAIWVNPNVPGSSLIIGTAKGGGLYVYDMAGDLLQHLTGGEMNNVDVTYGFEFNGQRIDLVTVGNRSNDTIDAYQVNPITLRLERIGSVPLGISPYGYTSAHDLQTGKYYGIASSKSGTVEQWELTSASSTLTATLVRTLNLGSVVEGLVADTELGYLYVAQEHGGLYKYGLDPGSGDARTLIDTTAGGHLTADTEGLAVYYGKNGTGYLLVSAQGANQFVVYGREGDNSYLATFDVAGVGSTDGIDVVNVPLGPGFSLGAFIAQNSDRDFRLVPWETIAAAGNLSMYTGPLGSAPGRATAHLLGTVTDDGQPDPPASVTTTWTRLSGPGSVTFADAASLDTTATFDAVGTYVLQLEAFDGLFTITDTVTVHVN